MNTLVIGANGGVGSYLVQQLVEDNASFTAGIRKAEQLKDLQAQNINAVLVDVENDSIETLTETFKGFDKVIFSVGSGASTGDDKTIIIDLDGAVKSMIASKEANVQQYIMVSTYDSRRQAFDASGALKPYTIAKHYADDYLRRSGLTYTIVHPGALTNDAGTGKVETDLYFEGVGSIPREDVATVLKEVVLSDGFKNQEFQVISGDSTVKEALAKYK